MVDGGYDLLLLDLVLPGRDGLSILSELAKRGDPTPVLVLSSHGQYEQTASALRAGAIDCIDKKTGRFLQIARIVRKFLEGSENSRDGLTAVPQGEGSGRKAVALLERNEAAAQEIRAILAVECPHMDFTTVASRTEWERRVAMEHPFDALVVSDEWDFADVTDALRDFRLTGRGGPVILISRSKKVEAVIAAFALGCRDCIVQKHGYHAELARSLNHLLRPQQVPCRR